MSENTLFDAANPLDVEFLSEFADACVKNSSYDLTAGGAGSDFIDVDEFAAGRVKKDYVRDNPTKRAKLMAEHFATKIRELRESGVTISRLAFVERDAGPVGMITYKDLIGVLSGMETCTLRPRKRILASCLKGRPLEPGESVALITDVATTGDTILEAAEKIWDLGGRVSSAFVTYDREQGASAYLSQYDIDLFPVLDATCLIDEDSVHPKDNAVLQFVSSSRTG